MYKQSHNKTIRTDKKFSVSMGIIAMVAILLIGSTSTNMVMAQQNQSGYNITVNVNSHGFGKDRVNINVQTENGYSANQEVATQGGASWTFSIPPNQGNSVAVCVGQGLIGANCHTFSTTGGDMSVSMGAAGIG
jgi:hypothetical protein